MEIIFDTVIGHLDKLKMHYLEIPGKVLLELNGNEEKGKFNQRVLVKVNDKIEWQGGIVALGEGKGYVTLSKARMKELDVRNEDKVKVELSKNTSEYGIEFPEELMYILDQDEEAKNRFEALTIGKRRTLLYYIAQAKGIDKRIEKAIFYMKNLKKCTPGKETFRAIFGMEEAQ